MADLEQQKIEAFIHRWESSGAAERANHQTFISELCDIIGAPRPEPAKPDNTQNIYVFEHPVVFDDGLGHTTTKFIDLYPVVSPILGQSN
jgi:restriction-modification enzyme MmeI-like protein